MGLLLQFVSLAVFSFGAPSFFILAFSYWRQGYGYKGSRVFWAFTVVCALTLLNNLVSVAISIDYPVINLIRVLLASLLPAMMAHLVLEQQLSQVRRSWEIRCWKILLALLYLLAVASAVVSESPWSNSFDGWSQLIVGASSTFALAMLSLRRPHASHIEKRQRVWNIVIFAALLATAIATLTSDNPFLSLVPDYLLLPFIAVRLYYSERLVFFDTFIKGGLYFAAGVSLLAFVLLMVPPFRGSFGEDWIHTWLGILVLLPAWIIGPVLHRQFSGWIDRALHRKYSAIQAERLFMQATQGGSSEEQLRTAAVSALEEIFRCLVAIDFAARPSPAGDDDLICDLAPAGQVRLICRESQIPFLSDDRRLLETLAATLSVLLQNVRLRGQQQEQLRREQELAALANRAELRALRAQIDPHFLFNALNAIAGWIRTEPEFADDTLAQLAEVFRYTLRRSQNEWVQMHEEIDFVRAYLAVEHARFGKRLETRVDLSPAANSVSIPAMVIQPLIENAIKHGVSNVRSVGHITLGAHLNGSTLSIVVFDNGPGFPPGFDLDDSTVGHGLRNVSDRLRGYYGQGACLSWKNTPAGTHVTIEIGSGESG